MELKEAILQTLSEIKPQENDQQFAAQSEREELLGIIKPEPQDSSCEKPQEPSIVALERRLQKFEGKSAEEMLELIRSEIIANERFFSALNERILVLFSGLQSPNNRQIEQKVDLILNFLEYLLAIIDERRK